MAGYGLRFLKFEDVYRNVITFPVARAGARPHASTSLSMSPTDVQPLQDSS